MDNQYLKKFYFIAFLSAVMMVLELASLGSLYTFINSIFDNQKLTTSQIQLNQFLNTNFNKLTIIYILSSTLCSFIVISGISKLVILNVQLKFSQRTGVNLSKFILEKIFLNKFLTVKSADSNELIALVTTKTNRIVNQAVNPLLQMMSAILIIFAVILFLIIIKPVTTIVMFASLFMFFLIVTRITKPRLDVASTVMNTNLTKSIEISKSAISNIRTIFLEDISSQVEHSFYKNETAYRKQQRLVQLYALAPKHILEMALILLAIMYLVISYNQLDRFQNEIGFLAILVYATQRSLPLFQQFYAGLTQIQSNKHIINDMILYIKSCDNIMYGVDEIEFNKVINFKDIQINLSDRFELSGLVQEVLKGEVVGIIGPTGHGKSTFIDLLCGLIPAEEGYIEIDNKVLDSNNVKAWQNKISLVPQAPYFESRKFGDNFTRKGIPFSTKRIQEVLKITELSSTFDIDRDFNLDIGENGVLLSGGQRQRLAIAKALHDDINILILDEATSALDNITEQKVLENLLKQKKLNLTVFFITHNLQNLKYCDRCLQIKNGKIIEYEI